MRRATTGGMRKNFITKSVELAEMARVKAVDEELMLPLATAETLGFIGIPHLWQASESEWAVRH